MSDSTRLPTTEEQRRWNDFQNHLDRTTFRLTQSAQKLGNSAIRMREFLATLSVQTPQPIEDEDLVILKDISNREAILQRLLAKCLAKMYGVQFIDGALNIVAMPGSSAESVSQDIYPVEGQMGIAPVIIVAVIAGITLLIAGDQAADRLDKEAKIESIKLQQRMVAADQAMAKSAPDVRASWDKWKQQNAANFNQAVSGLSSDAKDKGFVERFLGSGPTTALVIGALLIGGALAWSKQR